MAAKEKTIVLSAMKQKRNKGKAKSNASSLTQGQVVTMEKCVPLAMKQKKISGKIKSNASLLTQEQDAEMEKNAYLITFKMH